MSSKVMSKLIRTVRMMSFENLGPGVCSFPKSLKKIPILVALLGFGALVGREGGPSVHGYRCRQISQTKTQPLKFRIGGGACLGITGGEPDQKPSLWQVRGVPAKWNPQDVTRCLEGAGFQEITVLRRPVRSNHWLVICNVTSEFQNSIVFGVESHAWSVSYPFPTPTTQLGHQSAAGEGWYMAEKRN